MNIKDYIPAVLINTVSTGLLIGLYHFFIAKKQFLGMDLAGLEFQKDINLRSARAIYREALKNELERLARKASLGKVSRKEEEKEEEGVVYNKEL